MDTLECVRQAADNERTFSGVPTALLDNIKPREPKLAPSIENKADADSDIGLRGYVLFRGAIRDTQKSPAVSVGLRTQSAECSKLGKTWIITDASCGMVRNARFCGQICRRMFIWNFKYLFLIILYHPKKMSMLIAVKFHPIIFPYSQTLCTAAAIPDPPFDQMISLLSYDDL